MFRSLFIALAVVAIATVAPAPAQSFWLDGSGRAFTIDTYGRICIDGSSTGWYPDRSNLDLVVTPDGDAIYTDSYGRLCKNGATLDYSWIRPHYFRVDGEGNIYTVHDWVSDTIQKNGEDTPYRIAKGSGFVVDREGRLYYVNRSAQQPHRWWLYRFDATTGAQQHVAWLASHDAFDIDRRGNLWFAEFGWAIKKNGMPTGWRGPTVHLDGACNVYYTNADGRIFRSGEDTGYVARGLLKVSQNGTIVYVADPVQGELYRNGQPLGIHVGTKGVEPLRPAPDAD